MNTYFNKQARNSEYFFILESVKNTKKKTVKLELQKISTEARASVDIVNYVFVRYAASGSIPVFKLKEIT